MAQLEIVNAVRVRLKSGDLDKKLYVYSVSGAGSPRDLALVSLAQLPVSLPSRGWVA